MAFSPKQIQSIIESTARLNIWEGSVRSGKTIASIWRFIEYVRTFKDANKGCICIIGKTHKTIERNILDPIKNMIGKKRCRYNRGMGTFTMFGITCDVVGAQDERAQDKIRGATISIAYCDEITIFPESFFKMLLSRMSVTGAKLFGTTNPDSPYHWFKIEYLNNLELDLARFPFRLDDNINLDPKFIESLKKEYTGLWYRRFIDGEWVMADGTIYDMFLDEKHVVRIEDILARLQPTAEADKRRFTHNFMAIDYGTANPFVAGLFEYNKAAPYYMTREYHYDGRKSLKAKTDSEYATDMTVWLNGTRPQYIYVDPSAASFIAEMRKRGYNVIPANNDVLSGIRFTASLLHKNEFMIDRYCVETKREFTSYVWDSKAQKMGEDRPVKINDHCMDMIRYGLFTHIGNSKPLPVGFNFK